MGFINYPVGDVGSTPALGGVGLALVASQTFSAAATVSVNGCFTAAYTDYRIIIRATCSNAGQITYIRLRAAGADDTSANYYTQYMKAYNTTFEGLRTTAQTAGRFWVTHTTTSQSVVDITSPSAAEATMLYANNNYVGTTSSIEVISEAVGHNVASAYDGFTIYPATGTLTGRLAVYGYQRA